MFLYNPPPAGVEGVEGPRRIRLQFPTFTDLSGKLAIRLEVARSGEIVDKRLLFTTDQELGRLVLKHIDSSLEFTRTGQNPGPFLDVLFLRFDKGSLAVALHRYYAFSPGPEV
jgi:hypothetical protein